MKMPWLSVKSHHLLSAGLLTCFMCAGIAHAQVPVTPEQAAASTLTPYQQARDKALVVCNQQLLEQNVPTLQRSAFLNACVQAQGVVDPPPLSSADTDSQ